MTLADSTDAILHSLEDGRVDAAILRSDVIAPAQRRGLLNSTALKYVDAVSKFDQYCLKWHHNAQYSEAPNAQHHMQQSKHIGHRSGQVILWVAVLRQNEVMVQGKRKVVPFVSTQQNVVFVKCKAWPRSAWTRQSASAWISAAAVDLQEILPGYPYPVSTTLLPEYVFIAAPTVPSHTKKTIAEALFRSILAWLAPCNYCLSPTTSTVSPMTCCSTYD